MGVRMEPWLSSPHRLPPFAYQTSSSSLALEGRALALGSLGTGRIHLFLPVCPLARDPLSQNLFSTGRGDTFTINCSGFDQLGVDPAAFQAAFDRKSFRPVINYSNPIQVNISFTLSAILEVVRRGPHLP